MMYETVIASIVKILLNIGSFMLKKIRADKTPKQQPIILIRPESENTNFTGRKSHLKKIRKELKVHGMATLWGNGGFGKTQIAAEYAHKRKRKKYKHILFADAADVGALEKSYREIAKRTGLRLTRDDGSGKEVDFDTVKNHVILWLESSEKCLLVYDNAEGLKEKLRDYIPNTDMFNGHMLFCTRLYEHRYISHKPISVEAFEPTDAVAFLKKSITNINIDDGDARKLATVLDCIPLALRIAAAYINNMDKRVSRYIELLEQDKLKYLDMDIPDYEKKITATWNISVEALSEEVRQLFYLCAYCTPDDIPLSMFIDGSANLPSPLSEKLAPDNEREHDRILKELKDFALLTYRWDDDDNALMTIHGLVQETVRHNHGEDDRWLKVCLDVVHGSFRYGDGNKHDADKFMRGLPHVLKIAEHVKEKAYEDDEALTKLGWLYNEAGNGFLNQGSYDKALEWHQKALVIYGKVLGTEHPSTATTYNNMACIHYDLGNHTEALNLFQKAYDVLLCRLGENHPHTISTKTDIEITKKKLEQCPPS